MRRLKRFVPAGVRIGLFALVCLLAGVGGMAQMQTGKRVQAAQAAKGSTLTPEAAQSKLRSENLFLENRGQWAPNVEFFARMDSGSVWLTDKGIVYDFFQVKGKDQLLGHVIGLELLGSRKPTFVGRDKVPLRTDFMNSSARAKVKGARSFKQVVAKQVLPGIDMRHYFEKGNPRYDLVVRPGADPASIRFAVKGTKRIAIANNGDLLLGTRFGDSRQADLKAFQVVNGKRVSISAKFAKLSAGVIGFQVGSFDRSKELIIDPLVYGSYYGGDGGWDEVRAVVADKTGGVYITGGTRSPVFPNIYGPYGFNLKGSWDAYISRFQGDAYVHDYCAYVGGTLAEVGDRIQLDPFGDVWIAGRTESSDYPGNTRENVQYIRQTVPAATGGSFVLEVNGDKTGWLPWNASAATVQAALQALPSVGVGNVTCTLGPLPTAQIRVAFSNSVPYLIKMRDRKEYDPATGIETVEGIEPNYVIRPVGATQLNPQTIQLTGSTPNAGGFQLQFTARNITDTTDPLPWNATSGQIQAALEALDNIDPGEVSVSGGQLPANPQIVTFLGLLAGPQRRMVVFDDDLVCAPLAQQPRYEITKYTDIFIQRWKQSDFTVLDPLPTRTYMMGAEANAVSDYDESPGWQLQPFGRFANPIQMAIVPKDNPNVGDPVEIVVAGSTLNDIPGVSGSVQGQDGFIYRVNFQNDTFTDVSSATKLVQSSFDDELTGLAVDAEGSVYVCGTIYGDAVYDTSVTPGIFDTTSGVFFGGRLLRGQDSYLRKYARDGTLLYSALLGGNGSDEAWGIAVDSTGNAYVTGIARSFNFPRTRGVFGETFDSNPVVYVTKVNSDASEITYSTNLRTVGGDLGPGIRSVWPRGIGVDSRGQAFVTGMIFPRSVSFTQSAPALVTGSVTSSIVTTPDALQSTYTYPAAPQLPTWDGWITVLNQTATGLVYSSYIGGLCDEQVFAPHIDKLGDVWVVGSTDSFRQYTIVPPPYTAAGQLPSQYISPLAFKSTPDASPFLTFTSPVPNSILESPFDPAPLYIAAGYRRDGFLVKLRLNVPTIKNISLNPNTIAGGLGAFTTGTVTLTGPAPNGGLDLVLSINNTAASFDAGSQVNTLVLNIPQGASSGTFTVFSNPVASSTQVEIKASLEGNFQIAQLVVEPWLTQISVAPSTLVGGNKAVGRVRLYQNAINDITVDLSTDNSGLLSFPAQVIVPAGLDTITFEIDTQGVPVPTTVPITASLLGVGRTANVTLTPANLLTVTFNPPRVTGGSSSTGKVTLDGEAGGTFTVDLTMDGGIPPGYSITPSQLTFNSGDREQTFVVQTAYEANNTQKVIRATRPAQGVWSKQVITGTLFVDRANLLTFTIDPSAVDSGQDSVGTVTISNPADEGGAIVNLASSNPSIASVPTTVIVPSGATAASFTITVTDNALTADTQVTITASRGPTSIDRILTVKKTSLDLTVTPSSVVGGNPVTGKIVIGAPAPPGGISFNMTSSAPEAQVPTPVVVPAGAKSVTFTITTSPVSNIVNAVIGASSGSISDTANLEITPVGIIGLRCNPSIVRGGQPTQIQITLNAKAPGGGAQVFLSAAPNGQIVILPASVTVPAGQSTYTFTAITRRVSRTLTTTITGTYNGSSASGNLTVRR